MSSIEKKNGPLGFLQHALAKTYVKPARLMNGGIIKTWEKPLDFGGPWSQIVTDAIEERWVLQYSLYAGLRTRTLLVAHRNMVT